MDVTTTNTQALDKYKALRLQVPVIELNDIGSQDVIEPFPSKALAWYKLSKVAFLAGAVLAIVGLGLFLAALGSHLNTQSKLTKGSLKTKADILRMSSFSKQLDALNIQEYIQSKAVFAKTSVVFKDCATWHMLVIADSKIVFDYTMQPDKDSLDLLTSLDRVMRPWSRSNDQDLGGNSHTTTYVK